MQNLPKPKFVSLVDDDEEHLFMRFLTELSASRLLKFEKWIHLEIVRIRNRRKCLLFRHAERLERKAALFQLFFDGVDRFFFLLLEGLSCLLAHRRLQFSGFELQCLVGHFFKGFFRDVDAGLF